MSYKHLRTSLAKDTGLLSGHQQITDFRKRADFENLGMTQ